MHECIGSPYSDEVIVYVRLRSMRFRPEWSQVFKCRSTMEAEKCTLLAWNIGDFSDYCRQLSIIMDCRSSSPIITDSCLIPDDHQKHLQRLNDFWWHQV